MFTGIIEAIGKITRLQQLDKEWRLSVEAADLDLSDVSPGDSIAVNGTCLTVVVKDKHGFQADVSNETMSLTTLGQLSAGSAVNLEKALQASSRLGGHIISGHIDGVGQLESIEADGKSQRLVFKAPDKLAKYIATKGSIGIDGTSLTVNQVDGARFSVNIIPHTQQQTVIQGYGKGSQVNLEVDLISRYLERLMLGEKAADSDTTGSEISITRDFLQAKGFGEKQG